MRDPIVVCETSHTSASEIFIVLSVIFLLYLTVDVALAAVAILRTRPAKARRFV